MNRKQLMVYIHGKGGSPLECEHYRPLFPDSDVSGLCYKAFTPWEAGKEIHEAVTELRKKYDSIILVANSIGAFFSMNADIEPMIDRAFFISPIVNMEKLISDMMHAAGMNEDELRKKGEIQTDFGETLSWEYLCYVREHPVSWRVPTEILYGANDSLTSFETITDFAKAHGSGLTVMKNGEHWFHTDEQMSFLDNWLMSKKT